ncbi:hypothetical protein L3X38_039048 [Prunus dulcis]|uniref:Uncharacterized protein n=1 Tax=Prunus dulcis TaxID=3755 RepID=A0AAD4V6G8_PRUDU|nr:hypothetical protein L3X38_039048 [Prunus dulcis]
MACLDMYNSEHKGHGGHHPFAPMSPRISFSNDFADAQHAIKHERSSREAPVSSDFEFSVTNYSMMSADELFCKGRLLPFKDSCSSSSSSKQMQRSTTTLRDELLHGEDHDDEVSSRPPKGSSSSTRWKGLLGRKRAHIGSKKAHKNDGSVDGRSSGLVVVHEEPQHHVNNQTSQEVLNEGGSSWRDVEIGI